MTRRHVGSELRKEATPLLEEKIDRLLEPEADTREKPSFRMGVKSTRCLSKFIAQGQ